MGLVGEEEVMHESREEPLIWGLLAGITPGTTFLCSVLTKHRLNSSTGLSSVKDLIRNCLRLHSFKLMPWIPPKSLPEGPASVSTAVSLCGQRSSTRSPSLRWQHERVAVPGCRHHTEHGAAAWASLGWEDNCEGPQQQGTGNDLAGGGEQRLLSAGSWPDSAWLWDSRGEAVVLWTWLPIKIPPAATAHPSAATV